MAPTKAQSYQNSTKIRKIILSAALDVASREPWEFVSLQEIADSAGLEIKDIIGIFANKSDILGAIIDDLDTQVEKHFKNIDINLPARDRIFDVFMERIEIANQHRKAHISFFKSFGWTKDSTCADLSHLKGSMIRMAKSAGLQTDGLFGGLYIAGLSMVYLWVVLTWIQDTSPDLGKTMAELDKTLGRVEMVKSVIQSYAARSKSEP